MEVGRKVRQVAGAEEQVTAGIYAILLAIFRFLTTR